MTFYHSQFWCRSTDVATAHLCFPKEVVFQYIFCCVRAILRYRSSSFFLEFSKSQIFTISFCFVYHIGKGAALSAVVIEYFATFIKNIKPACHILIPSFSNFCCTFLFDAQFRQNFRICQQIRVKNQICVHHVAATVSTGRPASIEGCHGNSISTSICNGIIHSTANYKSCFHRFESLSINLNRISSIIWNIIMSLNIVVENEQITKQVVICNFFQLFYFSIRCSQCYTIYRHCNAVYHILYMEIHVFTALDDAAIPL